MDLIPVDPIALLTYFPSKWSRSKNFLIIIYRHVHRSCCCLRQRHNWLTKQLLTDKPKSIFLCVQMAGLCEIWKCAHYQCSVCRETSWYDGFKLTRAGSATAAKPLNYEESSVIVVVPLVAYRLYSKQNRLKNHGKILTTLGRAKKVTASCQLVHQSNDSFS